MVKEDEDHLKVFEKLFVHLIREYTQNRLDKIQRKKEDAWGKKKLEVGTTMGFMKLKGRPREAIVRVLSVKKRLCRKKRGTRVMGEKTASSQKRKYKIGKQVKSLGNQ